MIYNKMIRKSKPLFIAGIYLVTLVVTGYGQSPPGSETPNSVLSIIPPAPEAATLGRYGEIPVSEYTGTVDFSVPLTELSAGAVHVPVSLDYSSGGGVKPEEVANNAGLGWTVSAVSAITRSMMTAPDENGFLNTIEQYSSADIQFKQDYTNLELVRSSAEGCTEFQQDLFYYRFGNYSGKFFFGWDGAIVNLGNAPVKIAYHIAASAGLNRIDSFVVTDDNGLIYYFTKTETTTTLGPPSGCPALFSFNSSWYLSKIADISGNSIRFNYESYSYRKLNLSSQEVDVIQSTGTPSGCLSCDDLVNTTFGLVSNGNPVSKSSWLIYNQQRLKSIVSSQNDSLVFNYNTVRGDTASLTDISNFKSLDNIKSYNNKVLIRQWDLSHNLSTGRNTLIQLLEKDPGNNAGQKYTFEYSGTIPTSTGSFAIDHWGFYNGANNAHLVPSFNTVYYHNSFAYPVHYAGANREPNINALKGLLKKITYPTGGTTEFEYELNQCGRIGPATVESYHIQQSGDTITESALAYANSSNSLVEFRDTFEITGGTVNAVMRFSAYLGAGGSLCPTANAPKVSFKRLNGSVIDSVFYDRNFGFTQPGDPSSGGIYGTEYYTLAPGTYILYASAKCNHHNTADDTYDYDYAGINVQYCLPAPYLSELVIGGARIKSIRNTDPYSGVENTTSYAYTMPGDTTSSGVIIALPQYMTGRADYEDHLRPVSNDHCILSLFKEVHLARNPVMPGQTNGSPIGYEWVTVTQDGMGKRVLHFTNPAQYPEGVDYNYPYMPATSQSYKTGLLDEETDYNTTGQMVKKISSQYGFMDTSLRVYQAFLGSSGIDLPTFSLSFTGTAATARSTYYNTFLRFDNYDLQTGYPRLTTKTETDYSGGGAVTTTTTYDYSTTVNQYVNKTTAKNSDNVLHISTTTYPFDLTGSIYSSMVEKNMLAYPVITKNYKTNTNAGNLLSTQQNTYESFGDPIRLRMQQSSTRSNPLHTDLTVNAYDISGNILSYTTHEHKNTMILYGYQYAYPIAKIDNASDHVAFSSFEAPDQGNWGYTASGVSTTQFFTGTRSFNLSTGPVSFVHNENSPDPLFVLPPDTLTGNYIVSYWKKSGTVTVNGASPTKTGPTIGGWTYCEHLLAGPIGITVSGNTYIDELRLYPKEAVMESYTYKPGIGRSSYDDGKSQVIFYEYDSFNRLKNVRDANGKIIKSNTYQFQGPQ